MEIGYHICFLCEHCNNNYYFCIKKATKLDSIMKIVNCEQFFHKYEGEEITNYG